MAHKITSIWADEEVLKRIKILAVTNGITFGKMLEIITDSFENKNVEVIENNEQSN